MTIENTGRSLEADNDIERLAVLAVTEEDAEYANLRARLGAERVAQLERLLDESERDRAARLYNMHELERLLRESHQVRAAMEVVIEHQAAQLLAVRYLRKLRSALRRTVGICALPWQVVRTISKALTPD